MPTKSLLTPGFSDFPTTLDYVIECDMKMVCFQMCQNLGDNCPLPPPDFTRPAINVR